MGRFGSTEEIAETVVWMVRNAYLTNKVSNEDLRGLARVVRPVADHKVQVIAVDGGMFPQ